MSPTREGGPTLLLEEEERDDLDSISHVLGK